MDLEAGLQDGGKIMLSQMDADGRSRRHKGTKGVEQIEDVRPTCCSQICCPSHPNDNTVQKGHSGHQDLSVRLLAVVTVSTPHEHGRQFALKRATVLQSSRHVGPRRIRMACVASGSTACQGSRSLWPISIWFDERRAGKFTCEAQTPRWDEDDQHVVGVSKVKVLAMLSHTFASFSLDEGLLANVSVQSGTIDLS
ncbi:uncharacterized protein RCC_02938 [Ramularia collo-cygni]|uniref:Uncharacterized protein n=1 Tax=Ramularia collo-cygni TaxID=112498 RepID=A0A2D3V0Q3_9PEZI|nr:uncharacterized protein RCC_02938 [Ramularia collo-cygni]CZT17106.1 uncharacterized protein RCC_02938 [Ramularia collo-cygni]